MDRAVLVACMHQTKKNILIDAIATDLTYTFDDFLILIPMHLNPYCLFLANEDDGKKSLNIIFPPLKWTSKQASAQPIHFVNVGPISRLSIECVCVLFVNCEWGYKAKLCHCTKFKLSKWGENIANFHSTNSFESIASVVPICKQKSRFSVYKIINTASSAATAGCTLFYTRNKKMSKRQTNNNEPSCIPCTHTVVREQ